MEWGWGVGGRRRGVSWGGREWRGSGAEGGVQQRGTGWGDRRRGVRGGGGGEPVHLLFVQCVLILCCQPAKVSHVQHSDTFLLVFFPCQHRHLHFKLGTNIFFSAPI